MHFKSRPAIVFSEVALCTDALCAPTCCPFPPPHHAPGTVLGPQRGRSEPPTCPPRHNSKFCFSTGYRRHAFQDYFCCIHKHSFTCAPSYSCTPPQPPAPCPRVCLLPFSPERISRDSGNTDRSSLNEFPKSSTEKGSDLGDDSVLSSACRNTNQQQILVED